LDRRFLLVFWICASAVALSHSAVSAQAPLKKVRLGIAATSVGFLPIYTAYHRGFYKDEGIDPEIILMSLAAANNAFFKGDIDYSTGLTGLALAAVRNYPATRETSNITQPISAAQVVDFSFLDRARKELRTPR
jgi:ABC-type nitrate/sulfonate/bicarbonate transport system substrate-binding protein